MAVPARNTLPAGDQGGLQRLVGTAWLIRHRAHRHRGHRAAAADPAAHRKALCHSRKAAGAAGQDVAAVPAVVLQQPAGQHVGGAAAHAGWAGHAVLVRGALRPDAGAGAGDHTARDRRSLPRLPAGQPLVHLAGLHQPPDVVERHSGAGGSGRQDPHRGRGPQPRRHQLGGDARARQGLSAVPVAAGVARADRGRRPDRGTGRLRQGSRRRCRTTSRTRFPKKTGARELPSASNKLDTGWWGSAWPACWTTRSW